MPYKNPKLVYGLPQDAYPSEELKAYTADLVTQLQLSRKPVGIKFFFRCRGL